MSAYTLYVAPNLPTAHAALSATGEMAAPLTPAGNMAAPLSAMGKMVYPLTQTGNMIDPLSATGNMIDPYGRRIDYLRLSVTDRCDLRCTYCMSEHMQFLPKPDLLTLEELDVIASGFIAKGVKKLRITGGEPLVRRGIMELMEALSRHLKSGALGELTLTTNGTQLSKYAARLAALGVRRVNVSVDSFNADSFARITRGGDIAKVLAGIAAAQDAGLKVKINTVALKNDNADELEHMIRFAHERDMDLTLIETMPLGAVDADRFDQYIALSDVKQQLETAFTLTPLTIQTGGPARYYRCEDTGGILGLITPLSHNFCASCNRVRLTCTGKLYMCLGQSDAADLRSIVRGGGDLRAAIDSAIGRKPKAHDFAIDSAGAAPALARHMSVTGG